MACHGSKLLTCKEFHIKLRFELAEVEIPMMTFKFGNWNVETNCNRCETVVPKALCLFSFALLRGGNKKSVNVLQHISHTVCVPRHASVDARIVQSMSLKVWICKSSRLTWAWTQRMAQDSLWTQLNYSSPEILLILLPVISEPHFPLV